ncbi:hypothetical protein JCM3766R1_001513 [Sporobolomyces carnicolor]
MSTPDKPHTGTPAALRKIASTLVQADEPVGPRRQRRPTSSFALPSSMAATSSTTSTSTPNRPAEPKKPRASTKRSTAKAKRQVRNGDAESSDDLTEAEDDDEEEEEEEEDEDEGEGFAQARGTPRTRKRTRTHSSAGVRGSASKAKRNDSLDAGEELWPASLDAVLRVGLGIVPAMGRRSVILESDNQTYGRVGLLSEYLRRQTGMIRNRNKLSSHLGIQRRHASKNGDAELLELIDGRPLEYGLDLYKLDFDEILGPDLHPDTLAAAQEDNRQEKLARTAVLKRRQVIMSSGGGAKSANGGSAKKKRSRKSSNSDDDDDDDDDDDKVSPVKKKRGRPRKQPVSGDTNASPSTVVESPRAPSRGGRNSTAVSSRAQSSRARSKLAQTSARARGDDDGDDSSDLSSIEGSEPDRHVDAQEEDEVKPVRSRPAKRKSVGVQVNDAMQIDRDDAAASTSSGGAAAAKLETTRDVEHESREDASERSSWFTGGFKKVLSWF